MSQEAAAGVGPGEQCPQHQEAERERQAVGLGAYGGRRGGARGLGLAAAAWALSVPLSPAGARWSGLHSAGALSSLALTHRTDFFALHQKNEKFPFTATSMDLEVIMLSGLSQAKKIKMILLIREIRKL